ncbi:MAG TPA: hypothetical protein VF543_07650 [Pyrinomonadaceae bacterium]|jgi:hypothetical protein
MSVPIRYLEQLSENAKRPERLRKVVSAINEQGFWQEVVEWRIFTETIMRIEPEERDGIVWYKVSVKCDAEMVCRCPTIERAVEFLGVFERLTVDLFWSLGWPSWVAKNQFER